MMLQYGFFTARNTGTPENPIYDRSYGESFFAHFVGALFSNGVNGFEIASSDGLSVDVAPGYGCVNGYYFYNAEFENLQIAPVSSARTDLVAFRLSYPDRKVSLVVLRQANPTRNATTYDIVVGKLVLPANTTQIDGTMILDTREDSALCGVLINPNPVILYSGESNDEITLKEDAGNFRMLEIYYRDNDHVENNVKVHAPFASYIDMTVIVPRSGSTLNIKSRGAYINGNKITTAAIFGGYACEVDGIGGDNITSSTTNHIYITKVLGWR